MYWKMDAFRHMYAMAATTQEYNRLVAHFFGYGNEIVGAMRGWLGMKKGRWNPELHSEWFKDSENNALGVQLGLDNPDASKHQLIRLITKEIRKGNYYVRPKPDEYREMKYKDWANKKRREAGRRDRFM